MTDLDDWYDDEPDPAREEPYCPPCGDAGFIGRRHCADCNPTVVQHLWWLFTWRIRSRFYAVVDRLRGRRYDSEAPF
ncbi:hypothetical protein [Micromonospora sp. WMMD998]|uniref:hypothetical protein n=1 Tax=Micromonospora sp. WMMD998 TaxID=3016092 RepID=UPI00249A74A9|nr:hypothetical protein [Micromonospora sp. WMMD998]WFE41923.1 hypothetical protein O7619_27145 [Micromonospora sp. WMMD998]